MPRWRWPRRQLASPTALTPVPDEIWDEAARHYDEAQLGALVLSIALINAWNRLNVATRQITGDWVAELIATGPPGTAA